MLGKQRRMSKKLLHRVLDLVAQSSEEEEGAQIRVRKGKRGGWQRVCVVMKGTGVE